VLGRPDEFNDHVRLLFLSHVPRHPRAQRTDHRRRDPEHLLPFGSTVHVRLTWRESLHEFAPLLFRL
jgi:hypothetical protein